MERFGQLSVSADQTTLPISVRDKTKEFIDSEGISGEKELTGVLTYIVFRLLRRFYADGGWYEQMDAGKVVDSAIDEFKRRFLHSYEDMKIRENGDVK